MPSPDRIDAALGNDSRIEDIRALRPEIRDLAIENADVLLVSPAAGGLPPFERHALAFAVASLEGATAIATPHAEALRKFDATRDLLDAIAKAEPHPALPARLTALLVHARRLVKEPHTARKEHIDALKLVGISAKDIVTASQIIAFISFETRVVAGLAALRSAS